MVPVPKVAKAPLAVGNARRVLCSNAAPKLIGKVLRKEAVPTLTKVAQGLQLGSMPGGGTDLPAASMRAIFEWGRSTRCSVAVLFTDLEAAFYSILTEPVVGKLLTSPARGVALRKISFSDSQVTLFEESYAALCLSEKACPASGLVF